MEQVAKVNGSIRVRNLNFTWRAEMEAADPDDYQVQSSNAVLQIGDSFEAGVDQTFARFLRSIEEAMPRTSLGETCEVKYEAQLDAIGGVPLQLRAPGDGFITLAAPNGTSARLECQEFMRWANAVITTLETLRPIPEPRYRRLRRR